MESLVSDISEKEFYEKLHSKSFLVGFFADWCMNCLMMEPVIDEIAERFKGRIECGKVNVEENSKLSEKHKVASFPTLILFSDGKELTRITGSSSIEQVEEKLVSLMN